MGKQKINVKLLRKIQKHILEEPRRFDMDAWIRSPESIAAIPEENRPPCGAICCIAGWAVLLQHPRARNVHGDRGAELLGLSWPTATKLFYDDEWPLQFWKRFRRADDQAERAQVASERIDHFIKTNGAE